MAFRSPVWIPAHAPLSFPDPRGFDADGLIAGGGDLSPERLLHAYRMGIFPWYDEPPLLWWSPNPRAIITPASLHVSRSLRRRLRQSRFVVTCNQAPAEVMDGCADRKGGTWLRSEMKEAYLELFARGHLESYEVWATSDTKGGQPALVGGLYGVLVDGLFAAESKFHRQTDASKVALVCAVSELFARGVRLFDVQFLTDHLGSLGVHEIGRDAYLSRLSEARQHRAEAPPVEQDLLPRVYKRLQQRRETRPASDPK